MADGSLSNPDSRLRWPSFRAIVPAVLALVTAWTLANVVRPTTAFEAWTETSVTRTFVVTGAIPWALQLLAVLTLIRSSRRTYSNEARPLKFAAIVTACVGTCWWLGILFMHYGQSPLDAIVQSAVGSIERQFGGGSLPFVVVYRICGPLISIGQLRGPGTLAGANYFYSFASICVLVGYLTITARVCQVGGPRPTTVRDVVQFAFMISVIYVPCLLRLAIDAL